MGGDGHDHRDRCHGESPGHYGPGRLHDGGSEWGCHLRIFWHDGDSRPRGRSRQHFRPYVFLGGTGRFALVEGRGTIGGIGTASDSACPMDGWIEY